MKTVGQILLSARKKSKWTLDDVYKFTKIQPKYIKALESDDYSLFSGKVHVKGFLKNYAEFLELDVEQVMAFWRREYDERTQNTQKSIKFNITKSERPTFVASPLTILSVLSGFLLILFFAYLYYQYSTYSSAPELDIYEPENYSVSQRDVLDILGKTEADSELFINNQKVVLGLDGSFATSVKLNPGINTLNISVNNKLGRSSSDTLTVIYRDAQVSGGQESTDSVGLGDVAGDSDEVQEATESTPYTNLENAE